MRSGFFNSEITGYDTNNMPIYDRAEEAAFFAKYFSQFISNGVFANPSTSMQVVANTDMTVKVLIGACFINGYMGWVQSAETLDIAEAESYSRIDRVVARLSLEDRKITLAVKQGEESANPTAPDLDTDDDLYEIALADIAVSPNTIEITDSNIIDLRLDTELCGVVTGLIEQVDTTTLFNQYQSWLNNTIAETEANLEVTFEEFAKEFNEWFENLQIVLSGDVATNLQLEIETLQKDLETETETRQTADEDLLEMLMEAISPLIDEDNNYLATESGELIYCGS